MIAVSIGALIAVAVVVTAARGALQELRVIGFGQVRYRDAGPERWAARWRREHELVRELRRRYRVRIERLAMEPRVAIALVFGRYAGQALTVSSCETGGTFSTTATNGQYEGLFQMGSSERARFGHGATALEQARAAYVYFVISGRDWSPWSCQP